MTVVVEDHLEHYGVPGMKWGKRKNAERREKNAIIDGARGRQAARQAEVRQLTAKRISTRSEKGKAHLDRKIADKKFEIENNSDASIAKITKTSEKVMKGVKITALLGMSVVGLGTAASIVNSELNRIDNEGRGELLTKQWEAQYGQPKSEIKDVGNPEAYGRALGAQIRAANPGMFENR